MDYLTSGLFVRFPNLKLLYAESQMGWLPYVLSEAERMWDVHKWHFANKCPEPPSTYYWGRVYSTFQNDPVCISLLDRIRPDQVLFESDFPHQQTSWPNTAKIAHELLGHLDQETVNKLTRTHAIRLFGLEL